jgi:hypothetical protein
VGTELDLTRLTELQRVLGAELPDIIDRLVGEIDAATASIEAGVSDGDLGSAAHAAHAARNSVLMLDAQPVLRALSQIESGARTGDERAARSGLEDLQAAWPGLRRLLLEEAERRR